MTSEGTEKWGLIWPDHSADGKFYPEFYPGGIRQRFHKCDRAGGGYGITDEAARMLDSLVYSPSSELPLTDAEKDKFRTRLTTMLIDRRRSGDDLPEVTTDLIRAAMSKNLLQVHERADRLLRYIAQQTDTVGANVSILPYDSPSECSGDAALAWSESTSVFEVHYLLKYLDNKRWIDGPGPRNNDYIVVLTVDGYARIEEQVANVDSAQAFVAMWLHDTMTNTYEKGIEPAIREAGYTPLRIDQKEHTNKIEDEIIAEIRRSRFLIADFTQGSDGARGSVYYETGFAYGLGLPIIYTCQTDSMKELHFDTAHYNHVVWTDPEELREKLKNRILAVIGEGPEAHVTP